MKNSIKALAVVATLAFAGMANAQNTATDNTGTANATVICPITIHNTANLEFGTIINSPSGGSMTIPADNSAPSFTNVVSYTGSAPHNTPHAANYAVGGEGGWAYNIAGTITTNFTAPGGNASLTDLTWELGNNALGGSLWSGGTLLAAGSAVANQTGIFPCDEPGDQNDGDPYEGPNGDDTGCGCVTDNLGIGGTIQLGPTASGAYVANLGMTITYN